jgi:hypothetical protein
MAKPEDIVELSQALRSYTAVLNDTEPTLLLARQFVASLPKNGSERKTWSLWLGAWADFRKAVERGADANYVAMFERIRELGNFLPGLATTRPPFPEDLVAKLTKMHRNHGLSEEQTHTVMDMRPERGAHRKADRILRFQAYDLHASGMSYPAVADRLCTRHGNDRQRHGRSRTRHYPYKEKTLDPCSENFRSMIREVSDVLKKYSKKTVRTR